MENWLAIPGAASMVSITPSHNIRVVSFAGTNLPGADLDAQCARRVCAKEGAYLKDTLSVFF